jgi:hypothetical protein
VFLHQALLLDLYIQTNRDLKAYWNSRSRYFGKFMRRIRS